MRSRLLVAALLATAAVLPASVAQADSPFASPPGLSNRPVCPNAAPGTARCNSRVVTDGHGGTITRTSPIPGSYGPTDLQGAYSLPSSSAGAGQTIAIVDAYDDPNAAKDLATYRTQFGLPACNACFRKVNQNGQAGSYPKANGGWAQEISLDLDMASAICPNCNILLVEASSASFTNLGAAENTAARMGATVISNSYGGSEFSQETSSAYASYFVHPGIPITVSSGDNGYGVEFPASSQYVTAVGGTSLTHDSSSRGWAETAWSGAGSGCSAYVPKPSWQTDTGCSNRTVADVSAVADPNTGVAVYDSYSYQGASGWMQFGGTSVAAPLVAGVYALAGNGSSLTAGSAPYGNSSALNDVLSGSNGSCGGSYLCTAGAGFDGPTGLGTPNGLGAF